MNSSDPLVKDRGIVSNRGDRETSLDLHRRNSIQRERLDKELRRLNMEQQKCIRKSHLEMCSLSRDKKCLVTDLNKLCVTDIMSEMDDESVEEIIGDELLKSSTEPRRKKATLVPPRRVSLPALHPDGNHSVAVATKKERQDHFMDQKLSLEITKLKKASIRASKDGKESEDRKGKPRIPTNAWYHDNQNAKAREKSVFQRLSSSSNLNSMPSGEFLKSVRKRRTSSIPLSPKSSRKAELK